MQTKIRNRPKLFLLILIAFFGFTIALLSIIEINNDFKSLKKIKESSILSEKINYYDEVLTMSSRVGSFRDSQYWMKRYYDNVKPLENAINKTIDLLPDVKKELSKVEKANINLIMLEEKSFEFIKMGKSDVAQEILFSQEYKRLKQQYKEGLDKALKIISLNNKKLEERISSHIYFFSMVILFSILSVIISSFYIFKELSKQNKYIKQILNSQSGFVIITNGKKLKRVNQTTLDFLGYEEFEDFIDKHSCISDFFLVEEGYLSTQSQEESWFDVLLNNQDKLYNVKIKNKDENTFIFQVRVGKKIAKDDYVITFSNVTELTNLKLNLQEQVQKQVEDLRKKDLTLIEQSKMAIMGEMLENIAHQWRQPLTVICMSAASLKLQKELDLLTDDFLLKTLDGIENSSMHLSQTIDDFRNFYKHDSIKEKFSLVIAMTRAKELLSIKLKNKTIDLVLDCDDLEFMGNENELVQVFINILANAIDALDENLNENRAIFISIKEEDSFINIKIQDNAGGVSLEYLPKVFDHKFTTKADNNGTGLGLYMCKIIVDRLDGTIEVDNTELIHNDISYKGALFLIKLPVV